jgi:hypothetical protein
MRLRIVVGLASISSALSLQLSDRLSFGVQEGSRSKDHPGSSSLACGRIRAI